MIRCKLSTFLTFWKDFCCSSPNRNLEQFVKRDEELDQGSDKFAHIGTLSVKLFNYVKVVGGSISWMALALARSRSILFLWTLNPKNFNDDTTKAHFKGFILNLYCSILQTLFEIIYMVKDFDRFYNNIINISSRQSCNISWKIAVMGLW